MPDDPLAAIHREIERALAGKVNATLDEVQRTLDGVTRGYNTRAQPELGGRSPNDVHRLLSADWESPESAIRINSTLSLSDLGDALRLHDARALLEILAGSAPARLTPKGNLPRAIVAQFRERAIAYAAEREGEFPLLQARNEGDHDALHITRILLQISRLIIRRKGVMVRTTAGDRLAGEAKAGELYETLLRTQFRTFNLAYLDLGEPSPDFQPTMGFTFAQFGRLDTSWYRAEELLDRLLLPTVRASMPRHELFDMPALILTTRFLSPLVAFGLAERREEPGARWPERERFRRTMLWERAIVLS